MSEMILPKMLNIPEKLLPVIERFNDFRYFLLKGGRGGAKSQSIARFLLFLSEQRKLRIVCGREIQNTIQESVYTVMRDLITEYELAFEVQSAKIISKVSGSEITFRGFRQQGAFNIQGMEGVDIVWIDESQAITKQTLDILIPTIRKDKAKIIFSMNPHVRDDAVPMFLDGRDDCLTIHINYDENKHCTDALKREAEACRDKSFEDYEHIWLGKPLDKSEDAVFSYDELAETRINKHEPNANYGMRLAGFDIARYGDDKCAVVILQQQGALHWEEIFSDEWGKRDLNYTTGRILGITHEYEVTRAAIDEDGIGAGPLDTLKKGRNLEMFEGFRNPNYGYKENRDYANPRTANAYKVKQMVLNGHLALNNEKLIKEMCRLRYSYDHYQRKVLVSKQKMRDNRQLTIEERKSPNLADATLMAASMIGEVKAKQDTQYAPKQTGYYPEADVLQLAGV